LRGPEKGELMPYERAMSSIVRASTTLVAAGFLLAGCPPCHENSALYEPYTQAILYPERFDSWLAQHPHYFEGDTGKCLASIKDNAAHIAEELHRNCDETFTEGDDFWSKCHSEVSQDNVVAFATALQIAGRGEKPFSQTVVGIQLLAVKMLDPRAYETDFAELLRLQGPALRKGLTCEFCNPWWNPF
jgi:hypothetical protein